MSRQSPSQRTESQTPDEQVKRFFKPKLIICSLIFIVLLFFMNTHNHRLLKYITQMEQLDDSIITPNIVGSLDIIDIVCLLLGTVYILMSIRYTIQAFCLANSEYQQLRTRKSYNLYNLIFDDTDSDHAFLRTDLTMARFATPAICLISVSLLALLFMPPRDEMLQFMDESGLINVYLLILSFLLSPIEEVDLIRFEAEIEAMKLQSQLYQGQLKAINHRQYKLSKNEMSEIAKAQELQRSNSR